MGEVFAAYDERLDRRVAIKLIRPESAESPAARERFRREARAAAALNHPAVVQVHDVLAAEQGDAIVMEYVEGDTLAELARVAAPATDLALALAVQVAEGLAAAHAQGVVHRDLKAENVMVTPSGQAKILDFGLARRQHGGADSSATTGGPMGTYKAMSPEQARALPVNHLSDLFSFGTLLHELFSGRSPFVAASPLETLTNVCQHTPPLLRDLNPAVPEPLSTLVERLMEKQPGRRPQGTAAVAEELREILASMTDAHSAARRLSVWSRSAAQRFDGASENSAATGPLAPPPPVGTVAPRPAPSRARRGRSRLVAAAVVLVVVGAGAAAWLGMQAPTAPLLSVAVPQVILEGASHEALEMLRAGVRTALLGGLLSLSGVTPVAPDVLDPVPGSPLDVARAVAADELLTARLACESETCRITLARLDGQHGRLLWTAAFETPTQQPAVLPEVLMGHLRRAYPERGLRPGMRVLEVSQEDFTEYLTLRRGFDSEGREGAPLDTLDTRLGALRKRAPLFVEAGIFEAEMVRRRFVETRDRGNLDRAIGLLRQLREIAPDDPRPLASLLEMALRRAQLDTAEQALTELERLQPGDPDVHMQRARLLDRRQADPARILELSRSAARRRPSYLNLLRAAQFENRIGGPAGTEAARSYLEELLKRYPSYIDGQSVLAEIELLKGSPERAAQLYGELARRTSYVPVLANLGVANLLLARYVEAEQALRRAARVAPDHPVVALNLADAVLLQKRDDEARVLYRRALSLAHADPDASHWQMLSIKAQAFAHLGERRQAAEALQHMLAVAGDDAQAALDAAVTYAVLGDHASTLASAGRALRNGVDARWLSLPWFEGQASVPEFRALLAEASAGGTRDAAVHADAR